MPVKFVACDMDGTLVGKDGRFYEGVPEAIAALLERGVRVALASGRSYYGMRLLTKPLPFADELYYICDDGALVLHGGKTLYHKPISYETRMRFAAFDAYEGCPKLFFADTFSYALDGNAEFKEQIETRAIDEVQPVERLFDMKKDIFKLGVFCPGGKVTPMQPIPTELRMCYRSENWIEYNGRYANKGAALSDVLSRLFIDRYDTAALGDGENDVEMFAKAKYTFAKKDGHAALVNAAMDTFDDPAAVLSALLDR